MRTSACAKVVGSQPSCFALRRIAFANWHTRLVWVPTATVLKVLSVVLGMRQAWLAEADTERGTAQQALSDQEARLQIAERRLQVRIS